MGACCHLVAKFTSATRLRCSRLFLSGNYGDSDLEARRDHRPIWLSSHLARAAGLGPLSLLVKAMNSRNMGHPLLLESTSHPPVPGEKRV